MVRLMGSRAEPAAALAAPSGTSLPGCRIILPRPVAASAHPPSPKRKASSDDEAFSCYETLLHAERRSAAAGALHIRIFELESCTLERLYVIHHAAVQVHDRGRVDEYLQAVQFERLVHHSGAVLKLHRIRETGASAADDSNTQSGRNGILLRHDLFHLGDGIGSQ